MKTSGYAGSRPFAFVVELAAGDGCGPIRKSDVDALVAGCPCPPSAVTVFPSARVTALLFYDLYAPAADAVIFFWSRRLAADPLRLIPSLRSPAAHPANDLSERVRSVFSGRACELLQGDAVGGVKARIAALTEEIRRVSAELRRLNRMVGFFIREDKVQALKAERERIEKQLEEFRNAIYCVLGRLDGSPPAARKGEEIFDLGSSLDWGQICGIMDRECRRLREALPIYGHRREILQQLGREKVLVLVGETGSGKSTQLVQYLADSRLASHGSIVCTQPRKIAAMSLGQRVREESNGCYSDDSVVCYQTYSSMQRLDSRIIFMTDHCLLQHIIYSVNMKSVRYIVVDEAHERSLNTDLLLAMVKKLLLQRKDLKLIIMSATADSCKLSQYFFGCKTFQVEGRSFPVEIKYVPDVSAESMWATVPDYNSANCASYVIDAVKMAIKVHKTEKDGAILVFLTSQSEVEWACEHFRAPSAIALPLHGKLSCDEQNCVFQNYPGQRKVIFATNLAETSLTIPGVKYVVDTGLVKESRFEPSSSMNLLRVCWISQSSANQRAGRAGRTEPGNCYRLYSEIDFQSMAIYMEPEIYKVHLGIAILRILSSGTSNMQDFDFVDAPSLEAIEKTIENLLKLGAVICKNGALELTDTGRYLVKLGIEPRLGKLILDSFDCGLGREGLILAAVMTNASSIFCRVGNDEEKFKSDRLKLQFCHRDGDLFTLLSVYKAWEDERKENRNKWCWENSINAKSMRRCNETVHELDRCLQHELRIIIPSYFKWKPHAPSVHDKLLKKVILSSLPDNVAMYSGNRRLGYKVALTGKHVQLHPSCSLLMYDLNPSWVVFGEILSVSNQYLVCVTSINYECLATLSHPPFDVSAMESQKLQMNLIGGLGKNLLRRFCGKSNNNMNNLIAHIRVECQDNRIGLDADFEKGEIHINASPEDMERVSCIVNNTLQLEMKLLQDECIEKYLFHGGSGFTPVALFGAGAKIMHLELDKRSLSVEVSYSGSLPLCDKELLRMFDKCTSGIASFHRHVGTGQREGDSEKWGRITFLNPDSVGKAVGNLNGEELQGSLLKVYPLKSSLGSDPKSLPFPAIQARVCWPRRRSKGLAIVRCSLQDVNYILEDCSNLLIGGRFVRCEHCRHNQDSMAIFGLSKDTSEEEIMYALQNVTRRRIFSVFVVRGDAVNGPSGVACQEALLKEIAPFMPNRHCPSNNCQVQVLPTDPKDYLMKVMISFDGNLHLEAAKALEHIQGKVIPGCSEWQKIQCHRLFHSSVSCPSGVYRVIKKQLDDLFNSFKQKKDVSISLERNDNGSYRVKISSSATRTVAELRKPLEKIMKGTTITHPQLTPNVLQLLFTREGIAHMKSLELETGTYILHDKQNLSVTVFGPPKAVAIVEQKLVQSLLHLNERKQLEIHLRGQGLPPDLMKGVVQKFGPDLDGFKEKVPGVEITLNLHRHILYLRGSKELKQKVEDIVFEMARSLKGGSGPWEQPSSEPACPICLCEVEDSYQLEACGHGFCFACLVDQCESTIKNRDSFPICCAQEGCKSPILLVDLRYLLSGEKLEELFRASLGAFVAASSGLYRFCPSPDCPAVYRAADPDTEDELPFSCGACFVETCRKCHLEYHPSISCERYKEFKEDPDASLIEWRQGKDHVKNCPSCGFTIEKADGCNHIECRCGNHICWVCLEDFHSSDDCYTHLRNVHRALI